MLALAGCDARGVIGLRTELSAPPPSTHREEEALIGNLFAAYEPCRPSPNPMATGTSHRQGEDRAGTCVVFKYKDSDEDGVPRFLLAGLTLSDYYCDKFFRETNQSARHRRFSRGVANDAGGVVSAVLGLVKAGSVATGAAGAGFAAIDSSFRNYDDSFLVTPDLATMRRLVLAAQDDMKANIVGLPPKSFPAAESAILRYAGLCSFLGMQDLLNASIGKSTKELDDKNAKTAGTQAGAGKGTTPKRAAAHAGAAGKGGHGKPGAAAGHPAVPARPAPAALRLRMRSLPLDDTIAPPPPPHD